MSTSLDGYQTFESLACVCWRSAETSLTEFGVALMAALSELSLSTTELVLNLAGAPSFGEGSPFERPRPDGAVIGALVTLRLNDAREIDAWLPELVRSLSPITAHLAVYQQAVALPLDYERSWPVGEVSPGMKQISLLRRKPELDQAAFLRHWQLVHTPLALEVHPLWRYVRGVVVRALTDGAPAYEGIVELQFREVSDVTDLRRFYGGDAANMARIAQDVSSFIDLSSIELVHATERVLVSQPGLSAQLGGSRPSPLQGDA